MINPLRIAVITAPETDQRWVEQLGATPGYQIVGRLSAGDPLDRIVRAQPAVAVLACPTAQAEQIVRQLYARLPETICLAVIDQLDVSSMRRLVSAGARDVLAAPLADGELVRSISEAVGAETDRRMAQTQRTDRDQPKRGRLVVVTSPKGGVGTTTIATNLAIAIQQADVGAVLVADFGMQFGDVGVQLNIWSKQSLHDLLTDADNLDDGMLDRVIQQHSAGIGVLIAPEQPEVASDVTGQQIERVVDALLERYAYVVADVWSLLDDITLTLMRRADEVLIVTTPELPALKHAKLMLEYLNGHQLTDGRKTLVLNRFPSKNSISLEDVQQHLRSPIGANIPSDGELLTYSVNRGIPVVVSHPQSWAARNLRQLASYVIGEEASAIALTAEQSGRTKSVGGERRGWLSLRRRAAS